MKYLVPALLMFLTLGVSAQSSVNQSLQETNYTSGSDPGNTTVLDGNVMELNVTAPRYSSDKWAGVFGNVTTEYVVGNSNSSFYSWNLVSARYVFASPGSLDFASDWKKTNISYMNSEYSFLRNGSGNASQTFSYTSNISSGFQSDPINNTLSAKTYNQDREPFWETLFLSDGSKGFFAGSVKEGRSFEGSRADYQLILPEDGDKDGGTVYDMYLEIE